MAAPAIALRFRDTTPGVDTIIEHRSVLARNNLVSWGWWKKTFEIDQSDGIMRLLEKTGNVSIIIVDRTTERAFLCNCIGFKKPFEAELSTVPSYYRDHLDLTAGVFILENIEDVAFDITLGNLIGDKTFLWINSYTDRDREQLEVSANAMDRSCVLHLSDLHFGGDYGFRRQDEDVDLGDPRKTLTDCLISDLDRLGMTKSIAAMIVTGDFMTHGKFEDQHKKAALAEFEALRTRLGLSSEQIIPLPGNHDVVRYPEGAKTNIRDNAIANQARYEHETHYRTFVDELTGRDWKASLNYTRRLRLGEADLDICVINSCTIAPTEWTEYGYVGRSGLDAIMELGQQTVERPTFRFLALHHHLLPVVNVEALKSRGVTLTIDAADILVACQMAGVHVALHGHQHKPKIALYQSLGLNGDQTTGPIYVVSNGSAGAKNARLPAGERNTYCLFQLNSNNIGLWIRELRLDGQAGATIYSGSLDAQPISV